MRQAFSWTLRRFVAPVICFSSSIDAAEANFGLLRSSEFDFKQLLIKFGGTTCQPGSEFKPSTVLEAVFSRHPLWPRVRLMLHKGVDPDYTPLTEAERVADLEEALVRGNHKSAANRPHELHKLMSSDVKRGYAIPFPRSRAHEIPGLVLIPAGVVAQNTISELGKIVPKVRLTHNQSFCYSSGKSWNSRVNMDTITCLRYGHAMPRLLHYIVDFRNKHPLVSIFLAKSDYKAAYRRLHQAAHHAVQCGLLLDAGLILILTRMSFGGAPNPSFWSDISEMTCDFVNELLCSRDWEPRKFLSYLPVDMPLLAPARFHEPLGPAIPVSVPIELNQFGTCEVFIDDMILAIPDLHDNLELACYVLAIAIAFLERPLINEGRIERDCLLSLAKFSAKGQLSEHKTVLGWHLDTRRLTIALPKDKALIWKTSIDKVLAENGYIPVNELKTLDGRLTHLGSIVPAARHFSGDIHHYKIMAKRANMAPHQRIKLPARILMGTLPLWLSILDRAVQGFSMNNLVHRNPTRVHSADSSMFGIGVVNFSTGQAWRWQLPDDLKFHLDINLLEFLGSVLALLLDEGIRPMDCVLSKTDNTSAEGWLKSTNFSKTDRPAHAAIAEILGHDMMQREYCLYSQHWPGTDNTVCDVLSRDFHLDYHTLTSFLRFACPEQLPPHFHICSPSSAIVSRLSSTLQTFTATTPSLQVPTRSALWSSKGGDFSAMNSDSCPTSSLTTSNLSSESNSSEPSPTESAKAILHRIGAPTMGLCWPKPPKATSSNWQRPSSLLSGPTPDWIPTADLVPFYLANGVATRLRTDRLEAKR
jgi:hypothetical protein